MSSTTIPKVVPAQLSFLAIYNPSLGNSDDTFQNQIVFYHSKAAKARSKSDGRNAQAEKELREQDNEKLRQVGLAQGMVGFARGFSNGEAVDSVETQKSRIVLHELEHGWWILASIDLTRLPATTTNASKPDTGGSESSGPAIEYSSREVSPPALLLQQLKRAYSVFLLHHGATLDALFSKLDRTKFCNVLDKFWGRFASSWDVLLHGSPAVDLLGGMKLAAGGELGMGVGEEEWGSGEREVLEEYARKTDGLVDVMVSRFGEPSPHPNLKTGEKPQSPVDTSAPQPWLGGGKNVGAADGVVFSGVGALSRRSLRDVSQWVEDIYTFGEYAYGVKDSPTADRRKRRKRNPKPPISGRSSPEHKKPPHAGPDAKGDSQASPGIPPPIVKAAESSLAKASSAVDTNTGPNITGTRESEPMLASLGDAETWKKYLTLGYGTAWGGKRSDGTQQDPRPDMPAERETSPEISMRYIDPEPDIDHAEEKLKTQVQQENSGYFILGLKGDMEDDDVDDENEEGEWNNRIPLRTLYVEVISKLPESPGVEDGPYTVNRSLASTSTSSSNLSRLRPVIYVHRPFIYTFLFHHRTEALSIAPFYRNLHTYFSPLHRPLRNSTSPNRVAARISAASQPYTTVSSTSASAPNMQPIYDLVYDPRTLTVHSSLPNIPEPGTLVSEGLSSNAIFSGWGRLEALNVHSQILATISSTRRTPSEIERTCKTSRGWWVVWMRLPPSSVDVSTESQADPGFKVADLREAFLVRQARDTVAASTTSSGSRLGSGLWRLGVPSTGEKMGGASSGWGPKGLAEGIGIDARKYVEGLLSLNR